MDKIIKLVLAISILGLAACADESYVYHPGTQPDASAVPGPKAGEYYSIPSVVHDSMGQTDPSVQPPKVN